MLYASAKAKSRLSGIRITASTNVESIVLLQQKINKKDQKIGSNE